MCGIVGFIGEQPAAPILLEGLSKLEYRGYDSAGIAVRNEKTDKIAIVKAKGRLKILAEKTDNGKSVRGTCGIGHTRWATHGEPSENNAHPHCTDDKSVVLVHNGIIENYQELKTKLQKTGYTFYSQTDTEIAVKLIDYYYMKDYSRPSVIWGIDGDWMVNIIPAGVPFYPTDHCGVLRIKTEKILPEYMMYALQAEGEYERFSRNNRASAQRIRSLVVQAPETKIQKNIIDELKALDDKINGQNAEIEKYENSIRTKFDQIFHLEEFISDGVFSKYEGYSVEDLCIDGRGRVINQQYIENHKGPYPVYSSQTTNDGIFGSIDTFDFDGEYITWTTDGAKAGTVFYRNGKFNCTNVCGTLKAKNDKVNMRYLAYLLNRIAYKFVSRVGNNKLMNDAMKKIVVPVPKRQLQDEFADFVQSVEKSKFECIGKKEKFEIEKDTFVHKYFR